MNSNIYDLVIVGGGPSGLSLAQMCCKIKDLKILIIEREDDIGGCHRVRRKYIEELGENMFTQHSPVVYGQTYLTFQKLLKDMNLNFYDLFVKYNFNIIEIGGETIFSVLSFREISSFVLPFLFLTFNPEYGNNIVLYDFIKNFKKDSIEIIDRTCILTDGGDSTKFTLNQFLQLFNQQFFYSLYQPKLPNDIGLFKQWKEYLINNGVDFLLNTNIENVNIKNDLIESVNINNNKVPYLGKVYAKKFVFAIPPKSLYEIVKNNNIKFPIDLHKYANDTAYYDYVSFTFHWDKTLDLKKVYGFPKNDWGITFIKLSDYMTFEEKNSKTVLSLALTRSENISKHIGKTAHECTFDEIVNEVYLELKEIYGVNFEYPKIAILSPGVKHVNGKWVSYDTAFISSAMHTNLPFKNDFINNMYNVGTHNGKSLYKFTSLESAVSNSVYLSKVMYPELNDPKYITIEKTFSLSQVILFLFLFILLIIILFIYYGTQSNRK